MRPLTSHEPHAPWRCELPVVFRMSGQVPEHLVLLLGLPGYQLEGDAFFIWLIIFFSVFFSAVFLSTRSQVVLSTETRSRSLWPAPWSCCEDVAFPCGCGGKEFPTGVWGITGICGFGDHSRVVPPTPLQGQGRRPSALGPQPRVHMVSHCRHGILSLLSVSPSRLPRCTPPHCETGNTLASTSPT